MSRLKNPDPITADNTVTSEGALKLLKLLPDNYDLLSKEERQAAKESRVRYLERLEKNRGLERFKTTGRGLKYFKTQLLRLYESSVVDGWSLTTGI